MIREQPKRSIVKSLTWRIIAFATTIIAVYLYSGNAKDSLIIGSSANLVKMFLYYLHERVWNNCDFGRCEIKPPEYQI